MKNSLESEDLLKKIKFNIQEQEIIKELKIKPEEFLPLLFSLKFGGNWSFKTRKEKIIAIKDKSTKYNPEKMVGFTIETIFLFFNPTILTEEGMIYRLEKCSQKKEREIVSRPYKVQVIGEKIIKAKLNPKTFKITVKEVEGPLTFEGSSAFGISHEVDHLRESEKVAGKCLWDFSYQLIN